MDFRPQELGVGNMSLDCRIRNMTDFFWLNDQPRPRLRLLLLSKLWSLFGLNLRLSCRCDLVVSATQS